MNFKDHLIVAGGALAMIATIIGIGLALRFLEAVVVGLGLGLGVGGIR